MGTLFRRSEKYERIEKFITEIKHRIDVIERKNVLSHNKKRADMFPVDRSYLLHDFEISITVASDNRRMPTS